MIISFQIVTFVKIWSDWNPYYYKDQCSDEWYNIVSAFLFWFRVILAIGSILILLKIIVGILMLFIMKNNLHFYFNEKYKWIIVAMILSSATIIWRIWYTNFDFLSQSDLKFNYIARKEVRLSQMPVQITICIIDIFLPLVVLMYNIKTINFEKYLKNLLKGWNYQKHHSNASIFILTNNLDPDNDWTDNN